MELATQKYEVKFLETIILSLLLHGSLLIIIPKMQHDDIAIPEILNVEIDLTVSVTAWFSAYYYS